MSSPCTCSDKSRTFYKQMKGRSTGASMSICGAVLKIARADSGTFFIGNEGVQRCQS